LRWSQVKSLVELDIWIQSYNCESKQVLLSHSTVSSGVNALAASVVEDYVKKWKPKWNDAKLAIVSKVIATATGVLSFGFVYIAELMGNIFTVN